MLPNVKCNKYRDDQQKPKYPRIGKLYGIKIAHAGMVFCSIGLFAVDEAVVVSTFSAVSFIKSTEELKQNSWSEGNGFSLANFTKSDNTKISLSFCFIPSLISFLLRASIISSVVISSAPMLYLSSR